MLYMDVVKWSLLLKERKRFGLHPSISSIIVIESATVSLVSRYKTNPPRMLVYGLAEVGGKEKENLHADKRSRSWFRIDES